MQESYLLSSEQQHCSHNSKDGLDLALSVLAYLSPTAYDCLSCKLDRKRGKRGSGEEVGMVMMAVDFGMLWIRVGLLFTERTCEQYVRLRLKKLPSDGRMARLENETRLFVLDSD
jgi:hypothetical protein